MEGDWGSTTRTDNEEKDWRKDGNKQTEMEMESTRKEIIRHMGKEEIMKQHERSTDRKRYENEGKKESKWTPIKTEDKNNGKK